MCIDIVHVEYVYLLCATCAALYNKNNIYGIVFVLGILYASRTLTNPKKTVLTSSSCRFFDKKVGFVQFRQVFPIVFLVFI